MLEGISKILNTGLDEATLSLCTELCEQGVNPEALAAMIKEIKREKESLESVRKAVQR